MFTTLAQRKQTRLSPETRHGVPPPSPAQRHAVPPGNAACQGTQLACRPSRNNTTRSPITHSSRPSTRRPSSLAPGQNQDPRDEIMQSHIGVAKSRHRTASRTGRISMRPCPPGGGDAQPRPRAPNPVRRWLSSAGLTEPSVALLGSRPTKPGLCRVRESSPPRASDRVREGGREGGKGHSRGMRISDAMPSGAPAFPIKPRN